MGETKKTNLFIARDLSLESYWRAIILFGLNVASYKFALAKSMLDLAASGQTFISLEQLASPFARNLCEHLKIADKQASSRRSRFLDTCRKFNNGELTQQQLVDATVRLGFINVIDAFHVVNHTEVDRRFFIDERNSAAAGIRLTDEFFQLAERFQFRNLPQEVEARWRLVETAWELSLPRATLTVAFDEETKLLVPNVVQRRRAITSSRDALNGYQKGTCFYCFCEISIRLRDPNVCEVDHFLPHALKPLIPMLSVDGVWNLVLACQSCNASKLAKLPELTFLERLNTRNNFYITSHHPLRDTIMAQTGQTEIERRDFLQQAYDAAKEFLIHFWTPSQAATAVF